MRLPSVEPTEEHQQPCPNCLKGGLEYKHPGMGRTDVYRCLRCNRFFHHQVVDASGACGLVGYVGNGRRTVTLCKTETKQQRLF